MPAPSRAWRRDGPTICRSFGFSFPAGRCEAAPFSSKDTADADYYAQRRRTNDSVPFSVAWLQWILVLNSPVIWVSTDTSSIVVGRFSTEARECLWDGSAGVCGVLALSPIVRSELRRSRQSFP